MRTCPRCREQLTLVKVGTTEVDRCPRCHGAFFEPGEAAAILGAEADPEVWAQGAYILQPSPGSPGCPSGHEPMWGYRLAHGTNEVLVHVCGACRGLWLEQHAGRALVDVVRDQRTDAAVHATERKGGVAGYIFQLVTTMPVEVWNPVKKRPYLVYGLVASLTLIYAFQFYLAQTAPARLNDVILRLGAVSHELQAGYGLLTVVTSAFLHASWWHLLGNLYFLVVFGDNVEDRLGRARFTALYLAAAVGGALAFALAEHGSRTPMIGASGAISGLMGAYVVLFPRARLWVVLVGYRFHVRAYWYLGVWAGIQVVHQVVGTRGVAWTAHLGGLAVGAALAWVFRRRDAAGAFG